MKLISTCVHAHRHTTYTHTYTLHTYTPHTHNTCTHKHTHTHTHTYVHTYACTCTYKSMYWCSTKLRKIPSEKEQKVENFVVQKRWVLKVCLNDFWESECQRLYDRPFQVEAPTCENDPWPNALELEWGILRMLVSVEEQRSLEGMYRLRSSERYCCPVPVITLKQNMGI